jgi:hypothetical protein
MEPVLLWEDKWVGFLTRIVEGIARQIGTDNEHNRI